MKTQAALLLALVTLATVAVAQAPAQPEPPQAPPPAEQPQPSAPAQPAPAEPAPEPEALVQARALFKDGNYAAAADAAKSVLSTDDKNIYALYIAGVSALRLGRFEEAQSYLATLRDLEPNMPNLFFHLGHLAFARAEDQAKTGRDEEARASYLEAAQDFENQIAREPGHAQSLSSRPLALARAGQIDDAARAYEAWITANPTALQAYIALGSLYAELGRAPDAAAVFGRMPKDNAKAAADAAYSLARTLYIKERYEDALAMLKNVFELDPESRPALGLRTMTLARLNRFEEMAQELCRYVALDPPLEEGSTVGEVIKKQFGDWALGGAPPPNPSGFIPAEVKKRASPRYPEQARRDRVEAQMMLLVVVKKDATPGDICLVPTAFWKNLKEMGLDQAANDAVLRSKFKPASNSAGELVESHVPITIVFSMR